MNDTFNGTFWLSFCGVVAGILGLIFGIINKSKCKNVICCWGLFSCSRNIDAEIDLEEFKIEHNVPESPKN